MSLVIGDLLDLSQPPDFGGRRIVAIHVHHEGGGSELHEAEDVERMAMSRTDEDFARIPYHVVICRPVTAADGLDQPTAGSLWRAEEGRPLSMIPASIKGHNEGAVAVVLAGRWDREPLPEWGWELLVRVCRWLIDGAGLGVEAIRGHRELAATLCPGIDPAELRRRVATWTG